MPLTVESLNEMSASCLPGHLGIQVLEVDGGKVTLALPVTPQLMAPNGFLHAGSVVTLADTAAGYGCLVTMPEGASGFTTLELKSNHLGTATDGTVECTATAAHLGRTTQVWDSVVTHKETGKTIALFRCTQMILYPKRK